MFDNVTQLTDILNVGAFVGELGRVVLKMPMPFLTELSMGPERTEVTGFLIVYDYWKQLVITAYLIISLVSLINRLTVSSMTYHNQSNPPSFSVKKIPAELSCALK
jgi:hypothetical protein